MQGPPTRRRVLQTTAATLGLLAGCTSDSPTTETGAPPTTAPTRGDEPTETETYPLTAGPDERVTATPPGERALDPSGSWPQSGFDAANTGYNPAVSGLRDVERYWRLDAGQTPVVGDGDLYNVFSHDVRTKRLTRRDAGTATTRQETSLVEYGVTDPPTLGSDAVYVSTFVRPFAVDLDGGIRWRGPDVDGIGAPPTLAEDRLFVAGRGFESRGNSPRLAALTLGGSYAWVHDFEFEPVGKPAVTGDTVVVATERAVHAFDAETGTERWVADAVAPEGSPAIADGRVYVPGRETTTALALDTGETVWTVQQPSWRVVVTDSVVLTGARGTLVGADPASGETVWSDEMGGRPLAATGDVAYSARNGTLTGRDLGSGQQLWTYDTPSVRISDYIQHGIDGIAPVGDAIYVRAADALHGLGPRS